jgi:hypothetical protein
MQMLSDHQSRISKAERWLDWVWKLFSRVSEAVLLFRSAPPTDGDP